MSHNPETTGIRTFPRDRKKQKKPILSQHFRYHYPELIGRVAIIGVVRRYGEFTVVVVLKWYSTTIGNFW